MDGSILGRVTSATLAYAFYATKPRNQGELRETVLQSQQARNELKEMSRARKCRKLTSAFFPTQTNREKVSIADRTNQVLLTFERHETTCHIYTYIYVSLRICRVTLTCVYSSAHI